ncbi:two pore domain potassium channel family protein [Aliikangiella marina]|uniref:Two pore domain potassium channel family protein n=1 Tax=Aliikangiella marina TaxID=1712262 RepID=A0A545THN8_9GAMM|nr:two pore domain potassium channel family protein [Aliikangiella marina]
MTNLLLITLINIAVMALAVLIHYEFLYKLTSLIPKLKIVHRFRIVIGVMGALVAHVIEVWLFAFVYYLLIKSGNFGYLQGNFDGSLLDCVYFSFTNYTTLGYGDIEPMGPIRFLTGIESLTGLVMITWTASFLYYEMQRHWQGR